jgi:lambda repressor-like predicted transcriptional regulator
MLKSGLAPQLEKWFAIYSKAQKKPNKYPKYEEMIKNAVGLGNFFIIKSRYEELSHAEQITGGSK